MSTLEVYLIQHAESKSKEEDPARPLTDDGRKMVEMVGERKKEYERYIATGILSDQLIRNAIILAQLDSVFRGHKLNPALGRVDDDDVTDLRTLSEIIPKDKFVAKQTCILNPTFGKASSLVGGADADLLIDNSLIDVKTTQEMVFRKEYIDQLIGYFLLWKIGGTLGMVANASISQLGAYFSRHARLAQFSTSLIEENSNLRQIVQWFADEARLTFPQE